MRRCPLLEPVPSDAAETEADVEQVSVPDQLRMLIRTGEEALDSIQQCLDVSAGRRPVPRGDPDKIVASPDGGLQGLLGELIAIRRQASDLFSRISSGPISQYLCGRQLNEEEYYLLRALGMAPFTAESLGISPISDYDVMSHLWYNDEAWTG